MRRREDRTNESHGAPVVTVPLLRSGQAADAVRFAALLARDHGFAVRLVASHPTLNPRIPQALVRYLAMRSAAAAALDRAVRDVRDIAGRSVLVEPVLVRGAMAVHLEAAARGCELIAVQCTSDGHLVGRPAFARMVRRTAGRIALVPAGLDPTSTAFARLTDEAVRWDGGEGAGSLDGARRTGRDR